LHESCKPADTQLHESCKPADTQFHENSTQFRSFD
jgi:hypothetical protein